MRVLLIKANHPLRQIPRLPQPLGLLSIGTLLERSGDEVRILDYRLYWRTPPIEQVLDEFKPQLIGIGSITVESQFVHELTAKIRRARPDTPIVVGGPHASTYTDVVLTNRNIDYGVMFEGERTILELRQTLLNGGALSSIRGLAWKDESGNIRMNPPAEALSSAELDALPLPNLDLLDLQGYLTGRSSGQSGPNRSMGVFSSRGCPYGCTYCFAPFGKKLRVQSPGRVLDELSMIYEKHGIRTIEFFDDAFLADRPRAIAIMEGIVARKLPLKLIFASGLRCDAFTHEMIDLFKEAGTIFVPVGIETGSPRLQKMIKKHVDLDRLADNVEYMARKRIFCGGLLMLGFPTETYEEAKQTVDFACALPLHTVVINLVTPFKKTPLGDSVGDRIVDPVLQGSYATTTINLSEMTDRQLFGMVKRGYLKFFANPARIYRILRDHPNPGSLPQLALVLMRYLTERNRAGKLRTEKEIIAEYSLAGASFKSRPLENGPELNYF